MSAKNGDKSRHNINRRRAIARRAKLHAEAPAAPTAAKRPAKAKTTAPKSA